MFQVDTVVADRLAHAAVRVLIEILEHVILLREAVVDLRSFGPNVEVLAPASLRAELAQEARALAALYAIS
ncbi:WCX domain-containing protein [Paraburkholderia bannensis]